MAAPRPDIEAIFSAARLTEPEQRAAFLDEVCGDDALLRGRIERYLDAQSELGSFLESSAGAQRVTIDLPPVAEHPGTMIGPYKLLEPIGEGGMGTVWMAQQSEPIKRLVAIKLIRPGMDSEQVLARFDAERQALALMDHPNIAKVFDAGATSGEPEASAPGDSRQPPGAYASGSPRPYFVMELVKGVPITKYCDEHHLTPRQRLELFIPVCHAIQHAHQKGIIHRDIKPSNVLVAMYDDRPVPKVIDFGLAKATGQQLTEASLHTNFGAVVGTLEYMSPEQASFDQLDVDTRSDIYSLGVLLYELLAGSPPFTKKDLEKAGVLEMLRIIREQEPSKPSNKLSSSDALPSLSANRGTEPSRLTKLVRGELDWIVMKTLEKDRSRRYETANGFALDLQRYLADESVLACPPSMGYRLRKFARRNKRALLTTGVVALTVLFAVGAIGWAVRDREARLADAAKQEEARRAEAVKEEEARRVQIETGIARALEEAARSYQRDQLPEATGHVTQAERLLGAGGVRKEMEEDVRGWRTDLEMAARLVEISMEVAPDGHDLRNADRLYREEFRRYGLDVNTLDPAEFATRVAQSRIAPHLVAALDSWVLARQSPGQMPTLGEVDQKLLTIARRADPDAVRDRIRAALQQRDDKPLQELSFSKNLSALPPATLLLLDSILTHTNSTLTRFPQRIEVLRAAQRLNPDNFMITSRLAFRISHVNTTSMFLALMEGDAAEGTGYYRAALAMRPNSVWVRINLGMALTYQARPKLVEAEAVYRDAIRIQPDNAWVHYHLGANLCRQRKWADAEAELKTAFALKNALSFSELSLLGDVLVSQGKTAEAEDVFRVVRQEARRRPSFATSFAHMGKVFLGHWDDEAERYFRTDVAVNPNDAEARNRLEAAVQRRHKVNDWSLTKFLKGEFKFYATSPPDHYNWEHGLVLQCMEKQWYGAAARMYRDFLTACPHLTAFLFPAACAAARAGTTQGQDDPPLDENKRAEWRQQALEWLQADLNLRQNSPGPSRVHAKIWLEIWKSQPDLKDVREAAAIAKLPEAERQAWNKLWSDVDSRLRQFDDVKVDHSFGNVLSPTGSSTDDPDAHVAIGNNLSRLNKYDEAMAAFQEAIRLKPDHADAHKGLGHVLISKDKPVEAEAAYREAIRLKPDIAEAHAGLGLALQKQNRLVDALASCREAIRIKPDYASAHDILGAVLSKQGKPVEAEAAFREALKYRPDLYSARNNLARELTTQGKLKEAETEYREMVKRWPAFAPPHNGLAWLLATCPDPKIRNVDESLKLAKRAVELEPKVSGLWTTLGVANYRAKNWKEAVTALEKATGLRKGGDCNDWFYLAMAHWQVGDKQAARNWYDKAVDWADKNQPQSVYQRSIRAEAELVLEMKPPPGGNDHESLLGRAGMLASQGNLEVAVATYHKAIELNSKNPLAYIGLGAALRGQMKFDAAMDAFRKAIEIDPTQVGGYMNLGSVLHERGKYSEAAATYGKLIERNPGFAFAYSGLGLALTAQEKFDEAIDAYRKAIELQPKNASFHLTLGILFCDRKRDYPSAIAAFRKAISLEPNTAATHFNLGLALQFKGDSKEAIASYREAIRLQPNNARAHTHLARCLTTCTDVESRKPKEALDSARKGAQLAPQSDLAWLVLGWANYRVGEYKVSITALERSMALNTTSKGGNPGHWFFLAMANWHLGKKDEARSWYDQAVARMGKLAVQDGELQRIRIEAEEVLKIKNK